MSSLVPLPTLSKALSVLLVSFLIAVCLVPSLGVAQEEEVGNADIVLILDTSGSMTENDPSALRVPAAKLFVDLASDGDKFGIVTMAGPNTTRDLTQELVPISGPDSRKRLKGVIEQARQTTWDGTYMGNALHLAFDLLENSSPNAQRFVILLTDGLPDPAEQRQVVTEAAARFQAHPDWPVFPVALGEKADQEFLTSSIASPTGGRTFSATDASELVNVYLEVFELLLDDRYIEQVRVPPDKPMPVVSLTDQHRLTQLSFVVHRQDGAPTTETLQTPGRLDLVEESELQGVYRSDDPAYQVYTVVTDNPADMTGDWVMELGDSERPSLVTLMARSDLRTRLIAPRPSDPAHERSLRFLPADRQAYIQIGAVDSAGVWALGMEPAIQMDLNSDRWLTTRDDGQKWDLADDGYCSNITRDTLSTGDYVLRVEIPAQNTRPIHLYKTYPAEVLPLPALEMAFDREGVPFGLQDNIEGQLGVAPMEGITVQRLQIVDLVARDPQGRVLALEVEDTGASNYHFTCVPSRQSGRYTFIALAHIDAHDGQRPIPYVDFVQGAFDLELLPRIELLPETQEVYQAARYKAKVSVHVRSDTWRDETLLVSPQSEGLENLAVLPDKVVIPANESQASLDFEFFTDNAPGTVGELTLAFSSPKSTAQVSEASPSWKVYVVSGLEIVAEQTETVISGRQGGEVTVWIRSDSPRSEVLTVDKQSTGLGKLDVLPQRITVPASENTPFTFRIYSDAEPGATGEFTLIFGAQERAVALINDRLTWTARLSGGGLAGLLVGGIFFLLVVAIVVYVIVRKRR